MILNNFKEYLLKKSDSYKYYKNEYETSKKDRVDLKKKLSKSRKKNKKLENKLDMLLKKQKNLEIKLTNIKFQFNDFDEFLIKSYNYPFILKPFPVEFNKCIPLMSQLTDYLSSNTYNLENKPLISVIMPVYNRKDVVMNAIESVLNQTYENFELIIIDDGSTDGTVELLKDIGNDKISIIFSDENRGSSYARNQGLKVAKGEYIAYLDSDNLWCEKYLSSTLGAFLELPDADAVYSAQFRYNNYDSKPEQFLFAPFNKSLFHNANFIDLNSFAHKKSLMNKICGFDESLNRGVDWDFILRVSEFFKIYSVPFIQTKYYMNIVNNRISDIMPIKNVSIREKNEFITTKKSNLFNKVNIIIPIHNSDENLKECIKSILNLNLDNLKIIISNYNPKINISNYDKHKNIEIIESKSNTNFSDSLNDGIKSIDEDADIIILNPDAILTEGAIESMQKHAYELDDCGMIVPQNLVKGGNTKKHVPYADNNYWCDIYPSTYLNNIVNIPVFHDGEILELKKSLFFCSFIKNDVFKQLIKINFNLNDANSIMELYSYYIRNILGLNIYHISQIIVKNNGVY